MRVSRGRACVFVALSAVLAAFVVGDSFVVKAIIASVEASDWSRFRLIAMFAVVYAIAHGGVYLWQQLFTEHFANAVVAQLRERLFHRVAAMPLKDAVDTSPDLYFSTLTAQIDSVKRDLIDVVLWGAYLLFQLVFSVVAVLAINPTLGVVALLLCVPMSLVPVVSKRFVVKARTRVAAGVDALNTVTGDLLHGVSDWRLAGRSVQAQRRFAGLNGRWREASDHDATVQKAADSANNFMTNVLIFGVWIIGGLLIMRGSMSVAQVVAFFSLIGNISVPLFYMSGLFSQFNAGRAVLRKINETIPDTAHRAQLVSDVRRDAQGPKTAIDARSDDSRRGMASVERSSLRSIAYRNVAFHADDAHVRTPFSLSLDTSKRYLVVGPSGAGKSSLIRPLFGLDSDYTGEILVDGHSVRDIPADRLIDRVGLLSQSSHIFHASIRENVRLMDDTVDDRAILDACDAASIGGWVREQGLDYVLDDRLRTMSGGERQRILLARMLVRGRRFCVFDELTTGLDNRNAGQVEATIFRAIPGFVYITHRLNATVLERADEIIVMDGLTVSAAGSYQQVLPTLNRLKLVAQPDAAGETVTHPDDDGSVRE
ncbi:MAG: ABC transporter ATP-binding protein [Bifidobacterium sp.]